MPKVFFKNILQEIRHSFGRFFSILCIVMIGVAFFAGVKASAPDMKYSADQYFDKYNVQDIQIYSEEHKRRFEIKNDIFKIEKSSVDENKLVLTINRQPIGEWFKEQWEKLRHGLRQSAEEPRKSRGFRM